MSEPKRWIDEGPPLAVEHLLRAAATERPTPQSMARTLTALGIGASAAGAAGTAGAATAGAAVSVGAGVKASGLLLTAGVLKWGAVVTAVAAAGVAGKVVLTRAEHTASGVAVVTRAAVANTHVSEPVASGAGPTPSVTTQSLPAPSASASSSARSVSKSRHAVSEVPAVAPELPADAAQNDRLAEEVALVDRARGALAHGDAATTLAALDEYDARFTQRKFAPEALYLRMESLVRLGRGAAARGVANTLVGTYPRSPHADRARQLLAETIP